MRAPFDGGLVHTRRRDREIFLFRVPTLMLITFPDMVPVNLMDDEERSRASTYVVDGLPDGAMGGERP